MKPVPVSIVVPVFNSAKYLEKTLKSIQAQTWADFEVICVNDGSTDSSPQILQRFADTDSRFSILHQHNLGAGPSRNRGISVAGGQWLYFLDSDDWIAPNTLEVLVQAIERDNLDVVYFESLWRHRKKPNLVTRVLRTRLSARVWPGGLYLRAAIRARAFRYSPCTQFLRKTFVDGHHIRFPDQRIGQDVAFSVEVSLRARRVRYLPEALFFRNLRPGSLTTGSGAIETIRDALESVIRFDVMLDEFGDHPPARKALNICRQRMWRHALHRFDACPPPLQRALTSRHILEGNSELSEKFLKAARRGRVQRRLSRLIHPQPPVPTE